MLLAGAGISVVYLIIALLFSLSVHEASHALAAYALGDPTPKKMGRLSLNPMAHLDPIGVLMILTIGLGWGKPVRIQAENLKPGPKVGMALVAIAGPLSNLLLAAVCAIPLRLHWVSLRPDVRIPLPFLPAGFQAVYVGVGPLIFWIVWLSLALAVFNLIPFAPLDGSRLWEIVLPTSWYVQVTRYEIFGLAVILGLIISDRFMGTNLLGDIIMPPVRGLWRLFVGMTPPF